MTSQAFGSAPVEDPSPEKSGAHELVRWQRKLLPFMSRSLVVLAISFFVITIFNEYELRTFIKSEDTQSARIKIEELLKAHGKDSAISGQVLRQGLLLLEADALDKRYRGASAMLMSRIWTRQLAFMTGMVLAFIGAVFIIGKLSESRADVNLGASEWKAGISSTSPGLILAFLGTILMGIALIVQPPIEVQDKPVYFVTLGIMSKEDGRTDQQQVLPDPLGSTSTPGKQGK